MKKISAFLIPLLLAMGLTAYVAHSTSFSSEFQLQNLEALAASETYILDDCVFGTPFGDNMMVSRFCSSLTNDYYIEDCVYAYKAPLPISGKCVQTDF